MQQMGPKLLKTVLGVSFRRPGVYRQTHLSAKQKEHINVVAAELGTEKHMYINVKN